MENNNQQEEKKYTWQDLKDFVNNLPEEQLEKEVTVWGDEMGAKVTEAKCLEEDYGNPSGEGQEPRSVYEVEPDYVAEEWEVDYEKGTPILHIY